MKPVILASLSAAVVFFAGCERDATEFPSNRVHALVVEASRRVPTEAAARDAAALVEAWFGTPNDPKWPADQLRSTAAKEWLAPSRLLRAVGRVRSDQENRHFGLYNEHCVTCHGISGGGDGPASLLQNPYPRDFRAGIFKWKSTKRSAKPTRQDLMSTLARGAPGTGMPSFASLEQEDLTILVEYVIYLSIRGEFERGLIADAVDELGYEENAPEDVLRLVSSSAEAPPERARSAVESEGMEVAVDRLNRIVDSWVEADSDVIPVSSVPEATAESLRRGRRLFHGQIANCAGCHGMDGTGGMNTLDFDDWTKEFTTRIGITPSDRDAVRPFRQAGALRPRPIIPRRLADGVFRGGGDPEELYRRIVTGIAGTPMPAVARSDKPSTTALTDEQIWDLVHYVRSIGNDDS
jgi:mono/diheme cytochrome c family protein